MVAGGVSLVLFSFFTAWPITNRSSVVKRDVPALDTCPPCPPPPYGTAVGVGFAVAVVLVVFIESVICYARGKGRAYETYRRFIAESHAAHRARREAAEAIEAAGEAEAGRANANANVIALQTSPNHNHGVSGGSDLLATIASGSAPRPVQRPAARPSPERASSPERARAGTAAQHQPPQATRSPPRAAVQAMTQSLRRITGPITGNTGESTQTQNQTANIRESIQTQNRTRTTGESSQTKNRAPAPAPPTPQYRGPPKEAYKPQCMAQGPLRVRGDPPPLPAPRNNNTKAPSPTKRDPFVSGPAPPPHGGNPDTVHDPFTEGLNIPRTRTNTAGESSTAGNAPVSLGPRVRFASQDEVRMMTPDPTESTVASRASTPAGTGPLRWAGSRSTVRPIENIEEEHAPPPVPPHSPQFSPPEGRVPVSAASSRSPVFGAQQSANPAAARATTNTSRPSAQAAPKSSEQTPPAVPVHRSPVKSSISVRSPVKSADKSPVKSQDKSPVKLPVRSPAKPQARSPVKSLPRSPVKSTTANPSVVASKKPAGTAAPVSTTSSTKPSTNQLSLREYYAATYKGFPPVDKSPAPKKESSEGRPPPVPAHTLPVRSPIVASKPVTPGGTSTKPSVASNPVTPSGTSTKPSVVSKPVTPSGPSNKPAGGSQKQAQQQGTPVTGAKPSPAPSNMSKASYQATVESVSDEDKKSPTKLAEKSPAPSHISKASSYQATVESVSDEDKKSPRKLAEKSPAPSHISKTSSYQATVESVSDEDKKSPRKLAEKSPAPSDISKTSSYQATVESVSDEEKKSPTKLAEKSPAPSHISKASSYQATVESVSDDDKPGRKKKELDEDKTS
ncbi:hypothetical protein V8F20_003000 [Naviculisporaceae sp. PSN 640]